MRISHRFWLQFFTNLKWTLYCSMKLLWCVCCNSVLCNGSCTVKIYLWVEPWIHVLRSLTSKIDCKLLWCTSMLKFFIRNRRLRKSRNSFLFCLTNPINTTTTCVLMIQFNIKCVLFHSSFQLFKMNLENVIKRNYIRFT